LNRGWKKWAGKGVAPGAGSGSTGLSVIALIAMPLSNKKMSDSTKFIVDSNVGKLARWLRMLGYDAVFFEGEDDAYMIDRALKESRVILTRDTQIMKRGVITGGRLKAILIDSDQPEPQIRQVIDTLHIDFQSRPFTVCLECNNPLEKRNQEEVKERVPPYVFQTQQQYMECPVCHRIYWRGTHWQAMLRKLERLTKQR
jgi:uncharacterized protein with PIN domain